MQRVALYIRVSTQEQADEGYSIGAQTDRLTAYCKARDWLVFDTYIDPGFSGSNTDRPALKKLIHDVKKKKIDIVLVYKLDRLSRSQKDTLLLIEDVFNKHDVSFVSINENFDTSTAFGRAMIGILSVFAQLEREQIRERTMMGRLERAKDGYFHGGGFDPIGYDYVDGNLVINEHEALQVRKVYELFLDERWPITRIQNYMQKNYTNKHGSWASHSSVVSTIIQPIVMGKILYNGQIYEGRHEAIIDEERFKKAADRYEEVRWNKRGTKEVKNPFISKHVLAGLVYCGHCGARYFAKGNYSGRGENRYYRPYYTCYSRAKTNRAMVKDESCMNKSYFVGDLDEIIINEVKKLAYDPSYVDTLIEQAAAEEKPDENAIIEAKIADVDKQINRLLDLFQLGNIPTDNLMDRIDGLNKQKDQLLNQLTDDEDNGPRVSPTDALALLKKANEILDGDDAIKKREFLTSLINRIEIDGDDQIIHWAFI